MKWDLKVGDKIILKTSWPFIREVYIADIKKGFIKITNLDMEYEWIDEEDIKKIVKLN